MFMFFVWLVSRCVKIGANDHTLAVEAWKGLYQSIRSTQNANGRCDMASHKEGKKSVQILLNAKIEVFFSCKLHSVVNWMHSFYLSW